ncbi:MAG: adenylate/guanylate cyclase domain-containing protein, partial [Candidatus Brocadiae bacterium]|nr:adenylate/guanylate cyclase domain-containing protein [Candidatus Brocadiia bacterium]
MTTRGFAVTDIQGSARLWDRLGSSFAPLLAEHNRILLEASGAHGGRVLRREGDSFSFSFPDGASALRCAGTILSDLHAHPWPEEGGELRVRIGVHAGSVESGREEDCQALRLAGMVAAAAHGGQILASDDASAAGSAQGLLKLDLGFHRLAPGAPPVRLLQWLPPALASRRFPPPR